MKITSVFFWCLGIIGFIGSYLNEVWLRPFDKPALPSQAILPSSEKKNTVPERKQTGVGSIKKKRSQPPAIRFTHIGARQGLSQGHGICVFQDSEGFLWFGTQDGLNKYNGYQMTVYRNTPQDTALLSNNFITCIYEDGQKNLWIGTRTGLDRLDRRTGRFIHYRHDPANPRSLSNHSIHVIYEDRRGQLWVGTNGGGLNRYHPREDAFTHYLPDVSKPGSLPDRYVNALCEDRQGNLWVGTRTTGIALFDRDRETFTPYRHEPGNPASLSSNNITQILEDRKGNLWVSTWKGGLNLMNRGQQSFVRYRHSVQQPGSLGSDIVYGMVEDRNGRLWMGTENGGLNLFDPVNQEFIRYTHQVYDAGSLSSNTVSSLHLDKAGNIWLGLHRGGINYFQPGGEKFRHYYQEADPASLSNNNVRSFWEDAQGAIWIGTDGGGLNRYDRSSGTFSHFRHDPHNPQSLSSDVVLAVAGDSQGQLWLGTWDGGLNAWDRSKSTFTHYRHNPTDSTSISSDKPWALCHDRQGSLWIGTYDAGLNRLDKGSQRFVRFEHNPTQPGSLSHNQVKALAEDAAGNIWIGTAGGLDRWDPGTQQFVHYRPDPAKKNALSHADINALLPDHAGKLWIGTQQGLNCYDPATGQFRVFTEADGLCNPAIQGLLEDQRGNVWISTLNGLSRLDPEKMTFRNFSIADGLQANEFLSNACLKTRSGEFFLGGIGGFNSFYPDSVKNNPFIPPVYFTGLELFNRPVVMGEKGSPLQQPIGQSREITLTHNQSVVSFEFVALNYVSPEKNQYAYRLDGFDKDWNYVGTQRKATYTNLDPGRYTLRVKAANNDGVWNEQGASLSLIVTPPFWKTGWFRVTTFSLIVALIWAGYRVKTRRVVARNQVLEARIRERTRLIEQQKEEIEAQRDSLQQFNQEISHQKQMLEQKVNERTQELRARNEELLLLTDALPVLISYVDANGHYQFVNRAYEQWFGLGREVMQGKSVREVLGKAAYETVKDKIDQVLSGQAVEYQTRMPYQRGGEKDVSTHLIPHFQEERVVGFYALVTDISGQMATQAALEKALEEASNKNEQLEKINVDLDNFVYTASHDLKAPIANMEGFTNVLSKKLVGKLDKVESEMLSLIGLMTVRLKNTIADLAEISRVQKELNPDAEPLFFDQILTDVLADLQPLVEATQALITTEWQEKALHYTRKNLRSILYNLVGNALKYRSPERPLAIAIRTYREGEFLVLSVADNGMGLSARQLAKLFGMFKRFHSHIEGSGIGLYITKRIIENQGGRIEVESQEGEGTSFRVYFHMGNGEG